MAVNKLRGITDDREIRPNEIYRDTKKHSQVFMEWASTAQGGAILLVSFGVVAAIIPALSDLMLIIGLLTAYLNVNQKHSLPLRMPKYTKLTDFNDISPSGKPNQANGISFLGNEISTGRELWLTKSDECTHQLVFGTTGAGKTEALLSFVFNALAHGSGFVYVDGKGDTSLWKKAFSMARSMGRDDDLLLINYMTGDKDIRAGVVRAKLSHSSNPFSSGSSSSTTNLLTSLMDSGSGGGNGDMWKGRAISLASALMLALTYLRDIGEVLIDVHTIREYMHINKLIDLSKRTDLPEDAHNAITGYLNSLPAYNDRKGYNQAEATTEQHGFLYMQFTKILGSLSETYGYIFKTQMGEVDMYDVVVNRRILITMLPALEKPDDELTNLGKIIVSMLKSMMASCLGNEVVGKTYKIYDSKATNAETPFPCVLDEYGYYAVKGTAVMFAQARSMNIKMIAAGQDYPAFKKGSPEEAASIVANCTTKICGKLEDPTETLDIIQKAGGEAYTTHTSGFQKNHGAVLTGYSDNDSSNVDKRYRIDYLDLKSQTMGEMHVIMGPKIIRAKTFFANPKDPYATRLNSFLKIYPAPKDAIENLTKNISDIAEKLVDENFHNTMQEAYVSTDLNVLMLSLISRADSNLMEATIGSVVDYHTVNNSEEIQGILSSEDGDDEYFGGVDRTSDMMSVYGESAPDDFPESVMSEMNSIQSTFEDKVKENIVKMNKEIFQGEASEQDLIESLQSQARSEAPVIDRKTTKESIRKIELEAGETPKDAMDTANSLALQMQIATEYPEQPLESVEEEEMLSILAKTTESLDLFASTDD